jgi:Kef-type K+ transport system membrane component KefB
LASILFFAKIFGEIALKLGQSAIIGELLAGIVIGPSVFRHRT